MAEAFNTRQTPCPSCGAPILFRVGSSRAVVCEHCRFVVLRTDRGLETLGTMADLVPTGARLTLGARGRFDGVPFTLVGRVQMEWRQGAWDEWYAVLDDGRRGWLAESTGRYHFTLPLSPRPVPPFESLRPGTSLFLPTHGKVVVADLKVARYVTARGELPEPIAVGDEVPSADFSGPKDVFGTIDYSGDKPVLYAGREVTFDELAIDAEAPPEAQRPTLTSSRLACPNCGGQLDFKAPDATMRVGCPYCGALLDATRGDLRVLAELGRRELKLPLGGKATFFGVEYQAIGWLERTCTVEGTDYPWEEFLLYDAQRATFRWLVCSDEHWSFVAPVPAGEIEEGPVGARLKGEWYKVFSRVEARVTGIVGELSWAVELDERAEAVDYVRPPKGLSRETTRDEVTWSLAAWLPREQVYGAFGVQPGPARPRTVGALEPNPHAAPLAQAWAWALYTAVVALALLIVLHVRAEPKVVFAGVFPLADQAWAVRGALASGEVPDAGEQGELHLPGPGEPWVSTTIFSEPFVIEQGPRNLELRLDSDVTNSWGFVAGALINDDTGELDEFALESSFYAGADSDGPWSEDNRRDTTSLSALPAGHYTLRVESGWEPGKPPPQLRLSLVSGVVRDWQFLLVLLGIAVGPLALLWRQSAFEQRRWEESNLEGETEE